MMGSWDVLVLAVWPFEIHSDRYIELAVRAETGDVVLRVPEHAYSIAPKVGERVRLSFLMGQVTGVEPV